MASAWFSACFSAISRLEQIADDARRLTLALDAGRHDLVVFASVLLSALRRLALPGTELAQATCGSIRSKLLKLGAR